MSKEKEKEELPVNEKSPDEEGARLSMSQDVPWNVDRPGWDPILGLETIRNTMIELISDIFYQPDKIPFDLPWQPRLDMYSEKDSIYIDIVLSSANKENIQIHATSDLLIVRGEIPGPVDLDKKQFFIRERKLGKFNRSIPLPFEVIPERIKAHFKDGLLRIIIPVKSEKQAGSIRIEIE